MGHNFLRMIEHWNNKSKADSGRFQIARRLSLLPFNEKKTEKKNQSLGLSYLWLWFIIIRILNKCPLDFDTFT